MRIRPFTLDDYAQVVGLLKENKVEPPQEPEELNGPCFVAVDSDDAVIGVIFALAGVSTKAYIDYLAVRKDYQGTICFYRLLLAIEEELKMYGVKRYLFHVETYNQPMITQLFKYRETYRVTKLRDLHYFSKEITA